MKRAESPVILAHHWYMSRRGGERVFEQIAGMYPEAHLMFICADKGKMPRWLATRPQRLSMLRFLTPQFFDHRILLPLYPWAVRRLSVNASTRLLISSDAAVIKGVRLPQGCRHVCYCHSPPRYIWGLSEEYEKHTTALKGWRGNLFRSLLPRLRQFDRSGANRVDHFIANSRFVAERIAGVYGRESVVVYPGVDVDRGWSPERSGAYLIVGELVAYKRVDLAVAACSCLGRKLIVLGDGPEREKLESLAGENVRFLGRVSDQEVADHLARCRALLHPQIEDFGITAVEAQASGRPVIAFGEGGALETVEHGVSGLHFGEQTVESLMAAMVEFERREQLFSPEACSAHARSFSKATFELNFREALRGFGLGRW